MLEGAGGAVEFPLDSSMTWTVSLGIGRWWGESSTANDWPITLGSRLWWREASDVRMRVLVYGNVGQQRWIEKRAKQG